MTVGAGICVAERKLNVLGQSILTDVHENIIVTQKNGEAFTNGAFLGVDSDRIGSHRVFPIGKLQGLRFMCGFRFKLWWMTQRMGTSGQDIPFETQFLIVEGHDGSNFDQNNQENSALYVVFLPILEGDFRAVLQGNSNNELEICLESGDPAVQDFEGSHLVFIAAGPDPFDVITNAVKYVLTVQKDTQKQMEMMVAVPVTKEGRRLEAALGRSMEKSVKANSDALWARLQEESAKQEKNLRDRTQQITNLISNCLNKDMSGLMEKIMKKELAAVGQAVARSITPTIEKTISAAISEAFQKGVGDKAVNQLEKAVNSKLEATVARQIQAQFQTSGKQALQETLKSTLEASVIPAFEMSCKAMFEQVDLTFQKGIADHSAAAQQQFESMNSPLALALRLADSQRKLLALAVSGANSQSANPLVSHMNNGSLLREKIETPPDPTKELSRLLGEHKYEEAFTAALQRSDVSIVSWLCSQVDLPGLLSSNPLPLSQGVLLSLLQQLACDISAETVQKLSWMRDVLSAINPTDPMIAVHVRPIFEQVYNILHHRRSVPNTPPAELSSIRLILHVINSMLMTGK
ncbi:hypothetical protein RND71_037768 [Anisodus tanguticus]|uniref:Enhancer of mRNA-decapping protein 4 C-terminal domain-containing protein n=1 Tax=Anisodus tanguticus TaxID=243964 RepID=A0AAE1R101_9SOLA|nr:hypothetical protein RND71_037768 [Anisodus tanguticus]